MTLTFYIIIGLITFVAFLHAWSKKDYDLSRTIVINKSKAEVFGYVRQLRKQSLWMPWFQNDSDTLFKFKGEEGKLGRLFYWRGNDKIGEGMQKITKVKEGKLMETQLLFIKPYKTMCMSYMAVKEVDPERTKLVWGARGTHKFPASVVTLFYSVERAFGKDIEKGLHNLKNNLENR